MRRFIFLFFVISSSVYSQESLKREDGQKSNADSIMALSASYPEYPRIIPPSPEVASIFKFVDYAVNHSTGLTQISIPLYTVTCGDLTLPISIDYHASGRRYNDVTGPVGLGWILNAGGTIARTVYGFPDEIKPVSPLLKEAGELSIKKDFRYLAGIYYDRNESLGQGLDGEYDLYSYSLPGLSGNFVFYDGYPRSLSLNVVSIIKLAGSYYTDFGFSITAENGTEYIFGDGGSTSVFSPYGNTSSSANTSWYLKEIRSADGKHTIRLTYTNVDLVPGGTITHTIVNENMIVNDMITQSYQGQVSGAPDYKTSSMGMTFRPKRLKEIDFGTGKVTFDIEQTGGKINKIEIKDMDGSVVKTFVFLYSLLDRTMVDNYKLEQVSCVSGANKSDVYRFEYYPTSVSLSSKQCDYWGYVNSNSSSFFIPGFQANVNQHLTTIGHSDVNREPDETKKKSGVLKKIIYPTGNSTEYIYETNKYYSGNTAKAGPGLRIKQIKTTDDFGKKQLRTFEYGNNGVGSLVMPPAIQYWGFESIYLDVAGSISNPSASSYYGHYRQRIYSSEAPQDAAYYAGQPIFYSTVTEYRGDQNSNTGKTVYNYMDPNTDSYVYNIPRATYPSLYPAYYPPTMPKTFNFDSSSDYYRYTYQFGSLWKERNLTSQIEYENVNGSYDMIKSVNYQYEKRTASALHGLKVFKYLQVRNDYDHQTEEFIAADFGLPVFLFATYYITRGRELLTSVTENEIRQGHTVSTTRSLTYDSNCMLKNNTIKNSSGINQVEEIYYPTFDEYKDLDICKKMISLKMRNLPLKRSIIQNGKSNSVLTTYKDFGANFIKPSQFLIQKDDNTPTVQMTFHRYDSYGNPVYVTMDNMMNTVYLWGYKGMYPVAKIENATADQVEAVLGTSLESLSSSSTYDTRIDNLCTDIRLVNAHVTVYKYKPLVGISSITSPTRLVTIYMYDSFNRLRQISIKYPDGTEKVIETYNYNYRSN
ncbi:hypothetical protein [Bacteroides oleiciplenus]|uniref:YD repeat (Two copies) n=1 Tax=Bacteroides oleiciplenus YIT 12058 TaxID=742727 RepID=K9ER97_9BACE|nr:hypothetical protein [Bacteroides oleiciplenus]EKU91695.1 hypothetical protein HMPREF9447_01106 [Bacteroides oleiciplenus YIT 12058]